LTKVDFPVRKWFWRRQNMGEYPSETSLH